MLNFQVQNKSLDVQYCTESKTQLNNKQEHIAAYNCFKIFNILIHSYR